jgi:hypothetical protein
MWLHIFLKVSNYFISIYQVWDRIAPGLDSNFDAPYSVPVIAPRPLLILNGILSQLMKNANLKCYILIIFCCVSCLLAILYFIYRHTDTTSYAIK